MVQRFTHKQFRYYSNLPLNEEEVVKIDSIENRKFDYYYFDKRWNEIIEIQNDKTYIRIYTKAHDFYDAQGYKHRYNVQTLINKCLSHPYINKTQDGKETISILGKIKSVGSTRFDNDALLRTKAFHDMIQYEK